MKPLKFEISLFLYAGTLAIFARWLPRAMRTSRFFKAHALVVALAIFAEMVRIGGAAANGLKSHFCATSQAMQLI